MHEERDPTIETLPGDAAQAAANSDASPAASPAASPDASPAARSAALHRRAFVQLAALAAATFGLSRCSSSPGPAAPDGGVPDGGPPPGKDARSDAAPPFDLPTLGGAPDTIEGRTIAAFCDTVIPGKHRDPKNALGAIDVGAPALFFDPELPALALLPLLTLTLDGAARALPGGRVFAQLTPGEREQALERALASMDLLEFAVQLVKLGYLSSAGAATHLGYPGPNPGYMQDPDFSFRKALSKELTKDGNLD